jgi:DNA modification methylase
MQNSKMIEIGAARLWCGDALSVSFFQKEKAKLLLTDPPYRTISGGKSRAAGFGWHKSILQKNDGKIFEHNDISPQEVMKIAFDLLDENGDAYIMTNNLNLLSFMNAASEVGFKFHNFLQWRKDTSTANRWYMNETEHTLYYYKGRARPINFPASKQIFTAANPRDRIHPTQKPIELMAHYINNSTNNGDLVIDPFMGSGSTAIAALKLGRRFMGIEKNPEYFTAAVERIKAAVAAPDFFAVSPKIFKQDSFL